MIRKKVLWMKMVRGEWFEVGLLNSRRLLHNHVPELSSCLRRSYDMWGADYISHGNRHDVRPHCHNSNCFAE